MDKFYLEQILSSGKLIAMPLYRVKIQRISNLIMKVINRKVMTAIPNIWLKNGFDIEWLSNVHHQNIMPKLKNWKQ